MTIPSITILFEYDTLNGGERSMLAVIDRLRDAADPFQFSAIAPPTGPLATELHSRAITVHPLVLRDDLGSRRPREQVLREIEDAARQLGSDLLHANSLSMGRLTGRLANAGSFRCTTHLRDIIRLSKAAITDLNSNHAMVAVSEATRDFHLKQGLQSSRCRTVYNGVDLSTFQPRPRTGELRRELGLSKEAFIVLTVGQIGLRKAQDVLAAAAVTLKDRRLEIHYVLVGERHSRKAESIAFEQNVKQQFDDAGLADQLHCLGTRDDVSRLMNATDLLVHPAHQEPLGRVLLEAGASGLPIIATDVGGTSEIVRDGHSARLVPPGNATELANAIIELHARHVLRSQFATTARARMQAHFSIESAAENLAEFWMQTLNR